MFLMRAVATLPCNPSSRPEGVGDAASRMRDVVLEMTLRQLDELARMRAVGMACALQLERSARGALCPAEEAVFAKGSRGIIRDFVSVALAVRQIIVLERELAGLRPARRGRNPAPKAPTEARPESRRGRLPDPLRDDLRDYYDTRPVGEAVGWIRGTLGIEAPAEDPFRGEAEEAEADSDPVGPSSAPASPSPKLSHQGRGTRLEALPLDGGGLGGGDASDEHHPGNSASARGPP